LFRGLEDIAKIEVLFRGSEDLAKIEVLFRGFKIEGAKCKQSLLI
jgi:hypothetical protein